MRANLKSEFVVDKTARQPFVACSRERPTQLHAAAALWRKILDEYAPELAEASRARAAGSAPVAAEAAAAPVLQEMRARSLAHAALQRALKDAGERERLCSVAAKKASEEHTASRVQLKEAQEALRRFEPQRPSHKRQRTAFAAPHLAGSSGGGVVADEGEGEAVDWVGRPYANYTTVEYWRQEEGRIWRRRRKELQGARTPPTVTLPNHCHLTPPLTTSTPPVQTRFVDDCLRRCLGERGTGPLTTGV